MNMNLSERQTIEIIIYYRYILALQNQKFAWKKG